MLTPATIKEACTSVGVAKYGKPIGLDEKIKVDLIVIGSVAVDPKTGARLGKGEVRVFTVGFTFYIEMDVYKIYLLGRFYSPLLLCSHIFSTATYDLFVCT